MKAIDQLPEEFAQLLDNIFVTVEDEPSIEDFQSSICDELNQYFDS